MEENIQNFLSEEQDAKVVEKIYAKMLDMLITGETLEYIAVQKKPAVNIAPDSIVLTSRRIIFFYPKNLGFSLEFQDYLWKDIENTHFKEGFLGAEFMIKTIIGTIVTMDYLPKVQARKLYQYAHQKCEEMLEYRRQLDLENRRAANNAATQVVTPAPELPKEVAAQIAELPHEAPSINEHEQPKTPQQEAVIVPEIIEEPVPSAFTIIPPQTNNAAANTSLDDSLVVLKKLKAMFDNDLITKSEYDTKKAEILSRM